MDLAYGEFVGFDYCNQVHDLVEQFGNLVVTRTFSKAFGLAGLRVGWCHAPENMISGFYAARGMGSVNAMAQSAATAALSELDEIQSRIDLIISERERVAAALLDLNIETLPSYANFLLATISGHDKELIEKLVQFLFNEAGIIVNRTREKGLEKFRKKDGDGPADMRQKQIDEIKKARWSKFGTKGKINNIELKSSIENFYKTCSISRTSETMATCMSNNTNKIAAE